MHLFFASPAEVFLVEEPESTVAEVSARARQLGRRLHEAHRDYAKVRLHLFLAEDNNGNGVVPP